MLRGRAVERRAAAAKALVPVPARCSLKRPDLGFGALKTTSDAPTQFARVYEEHVWRVYGFLAYRLGDREGAEDLTQATFERALRAWPRYDPDRAPVSAWLMSIATNLLIDHHRRDRRPVALTEAGEGAIDGPEERWRGSSTLLEALARLGEREREVLALRFGGDLPAAAVAQVLGLTEANVAQISSRALRRLREILGAQPGDLAVGTPRPSD